MTASAPTFNPLVRDLIAPPIPTVQAWAGLYSGAHGPLLDLSQAVPGYAPHESLLSDIARLALDPALANYGDIEGEAVLRSAYAGYVSEQLNAPVDAAQIQITSGCNQAFVATMLALATPGDRVLLTNPCFFNHESALQMVGLEPCQVTCSATHGFVPDPKDVATAIEQHDAKVVALVSPNNPTGAVYSAACLAAIQTVCRDKGVWLVLDETYADFIGDATGTRHDLLTAADWESHTVLLYSFSKVYCTPGLRVGAIAAGRPVIAEVAKVMDNLQICAPRHAQMALAAAIPALARWRSDNASEIQCRATAFCSAIDASPGWDIAALGAYFAYVKHPFRGTPSIDVAERLARDVGVLCLPGTFFGRDQEDYLRIAFANVDVNEIGLVPDRLNGLLHGSK